MYFCLSNTKKTTQRTYKGKETKELLNKDWRETDRMEMEEFEGIHYMDFYVITKEGLS